MLQSDFCTCLFFELSCPGQLLCPSIVPSVRFLYLEIVSNEICRSRYIVSLTNRAYQDFQMILSTKSDAFRQTLNVIFKCGYCV